MNVNDRVRLNDGETFPSLGTITKISPAGYTTVQWDANCCEIEGMWSPLGSLDNLTVVTGDEAKPRHWGEGGMLDGKCLACKTEITEENYLKPCNSGAA